MNNSDVPMNRIFSTFDAKTLVPSTDYGMNLLDYLSFGCIIIGGFEILNFLVKKSGRWMGSKRIPVRGKHLDELSLRDHLYIGFNKLATIPFVYFLIRYMYFEQNVEWDVSKISVTNLVVPVPFLFLIYDFFYTILHWALHLQCIYSYIHKHHHQQKAPSRANLDAVNVNPIEFFLGEYNHILALVIYTKVLSMEVHALNQIAFLVIGAVCTGLNHSRYDSVLSVLGCTIFDSKYHDVHHRIPQSNYGQYTMFWDHVFGTFRPYNDEDRVNAMAQLDPTTGKSLEYGSRKKAEKKL